MTVSPQVLLVGAVVAVGVLHTIVPDHWVPITLIARQRGWSTRQTARAALIAGTGHVLSTLAIAVIVWIAGVAFAARFGHLVSTVSSIALIGFGLWIAIGSLREIRGSNGHHHHHHGDAITDSNDVHDHGEHRDSSNPNAASRTSLLLILGSSPMVEGVPAFFAAGKFGVGLIAIMALFFALSTIATYVVLCVYSTNRLQRVHFGSLERYGEVLSGACIAVLGCVFLIFPVL